MVNSTYTNSYAKIYINGILLKEIKMLTYLNTTFKRDGYSEKNFVFDYLPQRRQ